MKRIIRSLPATVLAAMVACIAAGAEPPTGVGAPAKATGNQSQAEASAEAKARTIFQDLYGRDLKRVEATADGKDDAALAKQLLEATKTASQEKVMVVLLYEKAVELASRDASGAQTAEIAFAHLEEQAPDRAASVRPLLLPCYRQAYVGADPRKGEARVAAAKRLVDTILRLVETAMQAGDATDAYSLLREAGSAARTIQSEELVAAVADLQKRLAAMQRNLNLIAQFKTALKENPADRAARKGLVELFVIELNNPVAAAAYLDGLQDADLAKYVPAAAKGVEAAPELACLELGDWHRDLVLRASTPAAKAALLDRARDYYNRFLKLHEAKDLSRTKATLAIVKVEADLATLASDADAGRRLQPGLFVEYYALQSIPGSVSDLAKIEPYAWDIVPRIGGPRFENSDRPFATSGRAMHIGAVFSGYLRVRVAGEYVLTLESDDGSALWINSNLVVSNEGPHGMRAASGKVLLKAGDNLLKIAFWQWESSRGLILKIEGPGLELQVVPDAFLWHKPPPSTLRLRRAVPTEDKPT